MDEIEYSQLGYRILKSPQTRLDLSTQLKRVNSLSPAPFELERVLWTFQIRVFLLYPSELIIWTIPLDKSEAT